MKITIYKLLGLIKDGKEPEKIKYQDYKWIWTGDDYKTIKGVKECFLITGQEYVWVTEFLNDVVEVIEEEKEIPTYNIDDIKSAGEKAGEVYRQLYEGFKKGWNAPIEEEKEIEFEDIESFGIHYSWNYIDYKNIEELKKYTNKDFQNIFDTLDKLIKNQKKIIDVINDMRDKE